MPSIAVQEPFAVRGDRSDFARLLLMLTGMAAALLCVMSLLPGALRPQAMLVALANALSTASSFAFAFWLHRAFNNLRHLRRESRLAPMFAVILLFLPLLNVLVAVLVLYELWRCSGEGRERPPLAVLWPLPFNLAALLLARAVFSQPGPTTAVAGVLACIGALSGMAYIMRVDARQWTWRGVMNVRATASAARARRSASTPPPRESARPVSLPSPQP